MTDPQLLTKVEHFAKPYCEQDREDPGLWKNHVRLVRQFALQLGGMEGVDSQVVEIAALLHDIGKYQGRHDHHVRSHALAKKFLETIDLPEATKELILECVLKHRTRFASQDNRLEIKVIQAADVLGTLFDDEWQEYCRRTMPKELILELYAKALRKIQLESARKIAEPQIARLIARLP